MTGTFTIRGVGSTIRVVVEPGSFGTDADQALADELRRLWRRCIVEDARPQDTVRFALTDEPSTDETLVTGRDAEALLTAATQVITRAVIRQQIGLQLLLHAGCVAHPTTGAALAFIAAGGTGKTTLATTMSRSYAYVTDETVAIDTDGVIEPYEKPLSVVGVGKWHKGERSPDDFDLVELRVPPVLTGLVLLNRDEHVEGVIVDEVPLLDAIEEMAPQSSSLHRLPEPLQYVARIIDMVDGVQRWTYSEHSALVPLIEQRLGAIG